MSLWNRTNDGGRDSRGRRKKPRQARQTERLEPKVVLGSMVPTETGTMVGNLLPIEAVDMLTPAQMSQMTAGDIAILEAELQFEQARQTMADIDTAQQDAADSAEDSAAEALLQAQPAEAHEATSETTQSAPELAESDASSNGLAGLLAMARISPADALAAEGEASEEGGLEATESEDDDDTGSDADAGDGSDSDKEAADNRRREDLSDDEGSRNSASQTGLTSAGGRGPTERRDAATATPVTFLGRGGGSGNPFGTDVRVIAPGFSEQATGFGEREFNPDATVVQYAFRDINGFQNEISQQEIVAAETALYRWEQASDFNLRFEHAPDASAEDVITIYKGDLAAVGHESSPGEVLGLGGTIEANYADGTSGLQRVVVVDAHEQLDTTLGDQFFTGTFDFQTIVGHEVGHALGLTDSVLGVDNDIMNGIYEGERGLETYHFAASAYGIPAMDGDGSVMDSIYGLQTLITGYPQLSADEVAQTLDYATTVTDSNDAIIVIVDRQGRILGARVEDGVSGAITGDPELLTFAIDGAIAKARTAAFFANGDPVNGTLAPITSRLIRFISQTTVTFRDVNSNPNADRNDPLNSTFRGPGTVAPIGVGGHFPPEIFHTPPVDLFDIEHTNTDSLFHPGPDGVKGTADDPAPNPLFGGGAGPNGENLINRFNVDPMFVNSDTDLDGIDGDQFDVDGDGLIDLRAGYVESYGFQSGVFPEAQARGIGTLPGGVPIYRDTNGDGVGETLIGAVGVFFPGEDGTADFEQGFQAGVGQTERQRLNATRVLEAEFIATVAAGGSLGANGEAPGAKPGNHPVGDLDIPFGRLDLVGIQLEVIGPIAGIRGVNQLLDIARANFNPLGGAVNGTNQPVNPGGDLTIEGESVPFGWLVEPHASSDGLISEAQVRQIVQQGLTESLRVRAAIRLPLGSRTRMVYAVAGLDGEVLGLFRQRDATIFSIDVAVGKARNVAYYADPAALQPIDQIVSIEGTVPAGTAFTNRTFRFLAEPRFPSGVDDSVPNDEFSILHDIANATGLPIVTLANKIPLVESQADIPVSAFQSVVGHNAFFPSSNFRDPDNIENQNNVVFFPGSTPLYDPDTGNLIGGFGVSGDGVDQDDVVTFSGAQGFLPPDAVLRADEIFVDNVRLPYQKFLRNPRG